MQVLLQNGSSRARSRCSRRRILSWATALCGVRSFLRAQEDATFSTDVRVVNVLATVRDRQGHIIRDLAQADFSVSENGRPQTIRYFSRESDLPLTLGLMVDTSMSQQHVIDAERGASMRFLDQVLRETKDHDFVMQFDMAVRLCQELTSSRRKLEEALAFVDTPTRQDLRNQYGGGTLLYDAVVEASKQVMKNQSGRKALIVLSDGVDTGSEATLTDATEAALRTDTLIYSILFSDPGFYAGPLFGRMGGAGGRNALMRLSKEAGGGFFEVSKKQTIDDVFTVLKEELRSQYSLGYVSDVPIHIAEFRKIQLTVNQKGLTVQARDRYWAHH
jgi:VWFA-related protein